MKYLIIIFFLAVGVAACEKETPVSNLDVEGYWLVLRDTTFTSTPANASADLYHLFRAPHAYYRFSFPKTFDFTILTAKPRPDSLISYYQTEGNQLQIPNPTQSTNNTISGNDLLSKTEAQMVFTRTNILQRDFLTGKPTRTRIDTITYVRVTDPNKVKYFDNYLKQWHP
jgi:hypothetical protein